MKNFLELFVGMLAYAALGGLVLAACWYLAAWLVSLGNLWLST